MRMFLTSAGEATEIMKENNIEDDTRLPTLSQAMEEIYEDDPYRENVILPFMETLRVREDERLEANAN